MPTQTVPDPLESFSREKKGPLRSLLNRCLNLEQIETAKKMFATVAPANNLHLLAYLYGTDKLGYHNYIQHYERHFKSLRKAKINLLEIGVGAFDNPNRGGESLRLWKKYFPNARVYGIDIHDKKNLDEPRIKTFQGSQDDPQFLNWVVGQIGDVNIVIDDGSHQNEHVITSFNVLFPLLAANGLYVVEDIQTSYWSSYGGNSNDFHDPKTSMCALKSLVDGLNFQDFVLEDYKPTYFDQHIVGLHFYHNMAFIQKGFNNDAPDANYRPSV
jgi:hypothetical protein